MTDERRPVFRTIRGHGGYAAAPEAQQRVIERIVQSLDGETVLDSATACASALLTICVNEMPSAPNRHAEELLRGVMRTCGEKLLQFADLPKDKIVDTAYHMGDNQPKH